MVATRPKHSEPEAVMPSWSRYGGELVEELGGPVGASKADRQLGEACMVVSQK